MPASLRAVANEGGGLVGDRVGVVEIRGRAPRASALASPRVSVPGWKNEPQPVSVPKNRSKPRRVGHAALGMRISAARCHLPAMAGAIAGGLEHFGEGHAAIVDRARISARAVVVGEDADARLVRMQAGQQRCARRAAARRVVELREAHAVRGQAVEVRRADLAAVAAEIREAHVVGEDQHDVRVAS